MFVIGKVCIVYVKKIKNAIYSVSVSGIKPCFMRTDRVETISASSPWKRQILPHDLHLTSRASRELFKWPLHKSLLHTLHRYSRRNLVSIILVHYTPVSLMESNQTKKLSFIESFLMVIENDLCFVVCLLQTCDINLFHFEHGLHYSVCFYRIRVI